MGILLLDATVQELFSASLASRYTGLVPIGIPPFVCFTMSVNHFRDVLTHYVAYLYTKGLKAGTIKSYLESIRHTHIVLGLGNPHIEEISQLERSDRDATMLWAVVTVCFFRFLRAGEFVAPPGSGFDPSIHL